MSLITRWISRTARSASGMLQIVQVLTMQPVEPSAPAARKIPSAPISPTDFAACGRLRWRHEDGSSISASGGRDAPRRVGQSLTPTDSLGTSPIGSGAVEADMRRSATGSSRMPTAIDRPAMLPLAPTPLIRLGNLFPRRDVYAK